MQEKLWKHLEKLEKFLKKNFKEIYEKIFEEILPNLRVTSMKIWES